MSNLTEATEIAYNSKFNNFGVLHHKDCASLMNTFAEQHIRRFAKLHNIEKAGVAKYLESNKITQKP